MSAQRTVRRLITYALLFALVVITAVGLSGLLGRLLVAGTELATDDVAGLARSLAFALIGGPLAALLWWAVWRRLDDPEERSAVGWGLYLAGAYMLALLLASTNVLNTISSLIGGEGPEWRLSLATGLVWSAVWAWHRWMWRHPRKNPTDLADVPTVLGAVLGLILGVGGAVSALSTLLDTALRGAATEISVGKPWWVSALQALVWAAGGTAVWWWHWKHDGGRQLRTGLADVALITVGVLGAGVLTLGGAGVALFVVLRLLFDRTESPELLLEPLAPAVSAAAIGCLVWVYHRNIARGRSEATLQGGRLVTSGVALIAAASGIGVIVNSVLAMTAAPLAGAGARTLLLAGISSLLVGGPVWWLAWRPLDQAAATGTGQSARRIYLVAVFGLSAVVAVVTLLVIGFRMFEFFLTDVGGGILVDRIRAPLGLLVATGLVFAYHFAVWRQDRAGLAAAGPVPPRTIGHVILVAGSDPAPLRRVIGEVTGAGVTVWTRADGRAGGAAGAAGGALPGNAGAAEAQLAAALEGVAAARVLVIADQHGGIDVIPLRG
ncbi:DUF5671 domain-containing protein [Arthrobacter oryzae]|uniref:DUF5671 domain-containing protein n=1 Tax=Arthrobacter oryzae TaxID=409290 RepID=A0A495FL40_9MICC|nr:DUF5671 domain-containing protein [Arthrobacter oryzae]RKR29943.1 hypothetical protein C8D78_0260 [Arthrobacter oryzae]